MAECGTGCRDLRSRSWTACPLCAVVPAGWLMGGRRGSLSSWRVDSAGREGTGWQGRDESVLMRRQRGPREPSLGAGGSLPSPTQPLALSAGRAGQAYSWGISCRLPSSTRGPAGQGAALASACLALLLHACVGLTAAGSNAHVCPGPLCFTQPTLILSLSLVTVCTSFVALLCTCTVEPGASGPLHTPCPCLGFAAPAMPVLLSC